MNVTVYVASELFSLGFTYNFYQNNPQKGMIYHYNNAEWIIGGSCDSDFTQEDLKIIKEGVWLPSVNYLLEWLTDNDFVFAIVNTNGFYEIDCVDAITKTKYHTSTPTLDYSLSVIIKKILKKKEREFDTKVKESYAIIEEDNTEDGSVCSEEK